MPSLMRASRACSSANWRMAYRMAIAISLLAAGRVGYAQTAVAPVDVSANQTLVLKPSGRMEEALSSAPTRSLPVFVSGERMSGRPDLDTLLEGNVEFRKAGTVIRADRMEYDQPTDQVKASGNVRINRKGDVFEGPLLELKVDAFEGFL
jgi:LPS-assembly protein